MPKTIFSLLALLSLSIVVASSSLRAQTPYLVKDINTTTAASPYSSSPNSFFRYGARLLFVAATESTGAELWITDGTAAGTSQVADINPRSGSSNPNQFVVLNGKVIFNAVDGTRGDELWTTDGTAAGTRLLADIRPGSASSHPAERIVYHGQLFFGANDGTATNLWITDGTAAGTRVFKTLDPNPSGSPQSFAVMGDTLYFWAAGSLWKSDGTAGGTVPLTASSASSLTVAGSHLFFLGYTKETGLEPWVSDGTAAGTHMLLDIYPGSTQSMYYGMVPFGDRVLFSANEPEHGSELWISDGTSEGTHIVRDISPGPASSTDYPNTTVIGGTAFFNASSPGFGPELWRTDGTEAGTTLVRDLAPGTNGSGPSGLLAAGNRLYFTAATDGLRTLWVSDGTAAGTREITANGARLSIALQFATPPPAPADLDGVVLFSASNPLNGYELWRTDGTDAGTFMVANLAPDGPPSSSPFAFVAAGDWLYFGAWDGSTPPNSAEGGPRSLWRSDGTAAGTLKVADAWPSYELASGRSLFFSYDYSNDVWESDGTPGGKQLSALAKRFPQPARIVYVLGDKVFATAADSQLWVTTTAPGVPAVQLPSPSGFTFVEVAGRLMYFAGAGLTSMGLWITDGTPAGTVAVVSDLGIPRYIPSVAVMGGALYFTEGANLRKSDGTFEGTVLVKSAPGAGFSGLTAAGTKVFFLQGTQLGVTDGTEAGTRTLPAAPSGPLAATGDRVVFAATDPAIGSELWVSDGTAAGTHLLLEIVPGIYGSNPTSLTSIDGLVYFSAYQDAHGIGALWVTDGTVEGTRMVASLTPTYQTQFVKAGERIFFSASTVIEGTELWAMSLPSQRLAIADSRVTEGDAGTATARFTVTLSSPSAQAVTVDYATADGTALAGSDYDATAGTLTFAPGETSKNIDVRVHGDTTTETNESFFVTLQNAAHATLARPVAFAIIEDDDQTADVALALDFSLFENFDVVVNGTNKGPLTATNLSLVRTVTPSDEAASTCQITCGGTAQLAANASARLYDYRWFGYQQYHSVTAAARQHDPQPSNNTVTWTTNGAVAMDTIYLTPGADANVWFIDFRSAPAVTISSSNPSVLSVPATVAVPAGKTIGSVVAHGAGVGTATLTLSNASGAIGAITVNVVAPGTAVRWPGAINATVDGQTAFDRPASARIYSVATAPYNGATATGVVRVTSNGQELARLTLPAALFGTVLPFYSPGVGTQPIKLEYAGDANFLPMTIDASLVTAKGSVTITSSADRSGPNATLHLRVTGSPMADPAGTLTIFETNVIAPKQVTLTTAGGATATADVSLTNLSPGIHTLQVTYSGDTHYNAQNQNVRLLEEHRRAARH